MADREHQSPAPKDAAAGELSADEADRLSEKYRPSWEVEDEQPAPAPLIEARRPAQQTLIGGLASSPPDAETKQSAPPPAAAPARHLARQTLIGIAPVTAPGSDPPPAAAPKTPAPPPPPPATVTSHPPGPVTAGGSPGGPSGIAKPYRPKDDPAVPLVVLTHELQKTEAVTNAEIEAHRRAQASRRHMQTVMNIKVVDIPGVTRPKAKRGLWRLALGAAALVVVVFVVLKLSSKDEAKPEPATAAAPTATAEPERTASPEATAAEIPAPPEVLPAEAAAVDSGEPNARTNESPRQRTPTRKAAVAGRPKKATPKPASPDAKEPVSPPPPEKGGIIVRDSPF